MKNDFHHGRRSTPASTQSRTSTGQFATTNEPKPKTTRTWHLKLMLGIAIAALLAIGALFTYNHIKAIGFAEGVEAGAQQQIEKQKTYEEMRQKILSENAPEKK